MVLVWNALAIFALLSAITLWATAAYVLSARPDARANRRLALLMALEGIVNFAFSGGTFLLREAAAAYALTAVGWLAVYIKFWAYISFLATINTPLAQRLDQGVFRHGLLALMVVGAATWFAAPEFYAGDIVPASGGGWHVEAGPGLGPSMLLWSVVWLAALAISVHAYRAGRSVAGRRLAKGYLIGFGFRDVMFIASVFALMASRGDPAAAGVLMGVVLPLVYTIYPLMVAYAILRHQLFDINLRTRRLVRRSTLAGVVVVAFFIAQEALEAPVQRLLGIDTGIVAAIVVALVAFPVRKGLRMVTDRFIPLHDEASRKEEVFRAAVDDAWADGVVSGAEVRLLERLREQLDIPRERAEALMVDVRRSSPSVL